MRQGRGQGVFVQSKHGNFIGWLLSTLFSLDMTVDLCFRKKNWFHLRFTYIVHVCSSASNAEVWQPFQKSQGFHNKPRDFCLAINVQLDAALFNFTTAGLKLRVAVAVLLSY